MPEFEPELAAHAEVETRFPEGIETLIENWQPNALDISNDALMEKVRSRYGDLLSSTDLERAKRLVYIDLVEKEWTDLLREKFPGRHIDTVYTKTPHFNTGTDPDIPWHRDGERTQDYQNVQLILWSNREPTEIRDHHSKETVILKPYAVTVIDNAKFEHRRPERLSTDRLFCHAAIRKQKI